MSSYDYVIVGAGSAGSALAGRLATNNNAKILLIEAGPKAVSYTHLTLPTNREV